MPIHNTHSNKYSLRARVQKSVQLANLDPDIQALSKKLDIAIKNGTLPTEEQALESLHTKQLTAPAKYPADPYDSGEDTPPANSGQSKLDIRRSERYMAYGASYGFLRQWAEYSNTSARNQFKNLPPYGDPGRDVFLSEVWKHEPILAGGIFSMTAKQAAMRWSVSGRRLGTKRFALMLSGMAFIDGYDWGGGISSTAEDFYTTNRGAFWENVRIGDPLFGQLADIGHIDALCCTLTGNTNHPMIYRSDNTGQTLKFGPGEYMHFASIVSSREKHLGAGFCAVDRALRAAILLMGLHDYDMEKLDNMPPEGIAAVTGLTMEEFQDAITIWKTERTKNQSLTFPQVLWLVASQPNSTVSVDVAGFSQLPEEFDRKVVVEQYINTLALAFGVDAREFWSFTGGGGMGSAGESEIQHLKAKGKGQSEFTTMIERKLNGEAGDDVFFSFDAMDIQDEADAAKVAKAVVDAYLPLYNLKPAGGNSQFGGGVIKANPQPDPTGDANPTTPLPGADVGGNMSSQSGGAKLAEQVITKSQLVRILVDKHVLPEWMASDQRIMMEDADVHQRRLTPETLKDEGHPDDFIKYTWYKGALTPERLPAIILRSPSWFDADMQDDFDDEDPNVIIEPAYLVKHNQDGNVDDSSLGQVLEFFRQKESQILGIQRNIRGTSIPEAEVIRGSTVNRRVIHDELERWRANPKLAPYALSPEDETRLFGKFQTSNKSLAIVEVQQPVAKVITPPDDKVELALKELQSSIQQLSSSNDNRLNVYLERLLTVMAESQSKQSNVHFDMPPITVLVPEQKPSVVNITMPEQLPQQVTVNMPEQKDYPQPNITFSPQIDVPIPVVNVNVPPANVTVENNVPVPSVTVNNDIPAPVVHIENQVNVPEEPGTDTIKVHRGEDGKIDSMTKVER